MTGRCKNARDDRVADAVDVGVIEDQYRRFPAQFQRRRRKVLSRIPHDMARRLGTAGERDFRNERMRGQRVTAVGAKPRQDVHHACRKAASWIRRANASNGAGPSSEALMTIVQPAASAGPIFTADKNSCEFQGTIPATTPTGSRRRNTSMSGLSTGR